MNLFISDISKKMEAENKDLYIYDIWEKIKISENIPLSASLEDVKNSCLIIKASHPGIAQQIRIKKNDIIKIFNTKCPSINLRNIKIVLESRLK